MQITINNEVVNCEEKITITKFIEWYKQQDKLPQRNYAIAVNMEFVPRSLYSETALNENDSLELVLPLQRI